MSRSFSTEALSLDVGSEFVAQPTVARISVKIRSGFMTVVKAQTFPSTRPILFQPHAGRAWGQRHLFHCGTSSSGLDFIKDPIRVPSIMPIPFVMNQEFQESDDSGPLESRKQIVECNVLDFSMYRDF
jgi:hypothetical protein